MKKNFDVIVIGGGPAGMMAAGRAAEQGVRVLLLERNQFSGKKLLLTGNCRCNLTNNNLAEILDYSEYYPDSGKFLNNVFHKLSYAGLIDFFNTQGVKVKIEQKGRVFPQSDRAEDIRNALQQYMKKRKVFICYSTRVKQLLIEDGQAQGVLVESGETYFASNIIVATGGKSYEQTGSSGDGYIWAKKSGHRIISLCPGLVSLQVSEKWIKKLKGLSLTDVKVTFLDGKRKACLRGDLIFTHFGISGPVVLDASMTVQSGVISIDCLPDYSSEDLLKQSSKLNLKNYLSRKLPKRFAEVIFQVLGGGELQKSALICALKELQLTVIKTRPFQEAMVTRGGIDTKQINPQTMESRVVKGLYFCGEVIDIAGVTGGYNLQAAFSTGYVAGNSIKSL